MVITRNRKTFRDGDECYSAYEMAGQGFGLHWDLQMYCGKIQMAKPTSLTRSESIKLNLRQSQQGMKGTDCLCQRRQTRSNGNGTDGGP